MPNRTQRLVFRLLLFFSLLFGLGLATQATTVAVGVAVIPNIQAGAGTYELRIWLDRTMVDSLGVTYPGGAVDSPTNFKRVSCALAGTTVTCDSFTLASTIDAQQGADAKYTAKLYRSGAPLLIYNKPFTLPASLGASVTWEQIWRYNNTVPNRVLDTEYYTKNQVNALYTGSLFANPATTTARGVGRSSMNVADPIFVETTDPRVQAATTSSRGTALLATDGETTAGESVQASDSRLAAGSKTNRGTVTTTTNTSTVLSADDRRLKLIDATAAPYSLLSDGTAQSTAGLQAALDAVVASSGQMVGVQLPAGRLRFNSGTITIPQGVALVGSWESAPMHTGIHDPGPVHTQPLPTDGRGTTIEVTTGSGSSSGCFISMEGNTALRGAAIYYPNQDRTAATPTAYPFTICLQGASTTAFDQTVEDVEILNPYQGIKIRYGGRALIRNVKMQALLMGLDIDKTYDAMKLEGVYLGSPYWSSVFSGSPGDNASKWQNANGVGIRLGRVDNLTAEDVFLFGYYRAVEAVVTTAESPYGTSILGGGAWAQFTNLSVDSSRTALYIYGTGNVGSPAPADPGLNITNLIITGGYNASGGSTFGVVSDSTAPLGTEVNITSGNLGAGDTLTQPIYLRGAGWYNFSGLTFRNWLGTAAIDAQGLDATHYLVLTVKGSIFMQTLPSILVDDYVIGTSGTNVFAAPGNAPAIGSTTFGGNFEFITCGDKFTDGYLWCGNAKKVATGTAGAFDWVSNLFYPPQKLFADLGTPVNGAMIHCLDCAEVSDPCTGSGTGSWAKRLNNRWVCSK